MLHVISEHLLHGKLLAHDSTSRIQHGHIIQPNTNRPFNSVFGAKMKKKTNIQYSPSKQASLISLTVN